MLQRPASCPARRRACSRPALSPAANPLPPLPRAGLADWSYAGYNAGERAIPGPATYPALFNVRSYGAVGDGRADDSTAFVNALKAASAYAKATFTTPYDAGFQNNGTGGVAVLVPAGTYRITKARARGVEGAGGVTPTGQRRECAA